MSPIACKTRKEKVNRRINQHSALCKYSGLTPLWGTVWPDLIIGDKPPLNTAKNGYPKTWVVGEIKRSTKTLYNDYIRNPNSTQLEGIVNYTKKHTYPRVVFFLAAKKANGKQYQTVEATLAVKVVAKGAVPIVDTIFDHKGKRRR